MKLKFTFLSLFATLLLAGCGEKTEIPLSGQWRFALDANDDGLNQKWYQNSLKESINLPGSLQDQGFGDNISVDTKWTGEIVDSSWFNSPEYEKYRKDGNVKVHFWLNPEKHYVGVAWYQRDIEVPVDWEDNIITLDLERTHWQTTVWVDDQCYGEKTSLHTPNRYELGGLTSGKHTITLRVDNRVHIAVGTNAHSVSNHTQTNWNGVIGNISLNAKPKTYIENLKIYPDVDKKEARVIVTVINHSQNVDNKTITIDVNSLTGGRSVPSVEQQFALKPGENKIDITIPMGDNILLWDEFSPNVYQMTATVGDHTFESNFGMRNMTKEGRRLSINGRPLFLRGTLECCIFPLTGYPAMDSQYWKKIYSAVQGHGLNHVRFHSWCPPKVAFDVADSMGVYLQVECGAWAWLGMGNSFEEWLYAESDRILAEYGNHPSFVMLMHGNEPWGKRITETLTELCQHWKDSDGRHLYSSSAGWPYIENGDFFSNPAPRIQRWGEGVNSVINAQAPNTMYDFSTTIQSVDMPTISHEIGQWCVYPNFKEIEKYTGSLKAKNFEIFRETLHDNGLGSLADSFLMASGKLQTLCYKADIEAALRTPEFAGFQLLDLHDFPGQGTALVGVLDAFWDEKGYVTPQQYKQFCNSTVPLARIEKLIYSNTDNFKADIEVSHFESQPAQNAIINWRVIDGSRSIANGSFTSNLPITNCIKVGKIDIPLASISEATQLKLEVEIPSLNALNSWNFWVYPPVEVKTDDIYVTSKFDAIAEKKLKNGDKVMLSLNRGSVNNDVVVGFSSIFWNTLWTTNQPPHTLGIFCDPKHAALSQFPTASYSDYQWWEVVSNSDALVLNDMPNELTPIVYMVDDWFKNRRLALAFEANVNGGKLLVTSVDFTTDIDKRLSAKQLKKSLINYMASADFAPKTSLTTQQVKSLMK